MIDHFVFFLFVDGVAVGNHLIYPQHQDGVALLGSYVDGSDVGADIALLCHNNDQPLPAHRSILAMRSERFRALFNSGMVL